MSKRSPDRRIIRTRAMLRDALTQLMEEKGFEGITVRDLTEKADISRGTFYLHYKDKYDLLEQSEKDILNTLLSIGTDEIPEISLNTIAQAGLNEPAPFLIKLFTFIQEHGEFMKVNLGPKGNPSFQDDLKEVMKRKIIRERMKHLNKDDMLVPEDYLTAYVTSAHLGVLQHWLSSGMKVSPTELAVILSKTTFLGPAYVAGIRKE